MGHPLENSHKQLQVKGVAPALNTKNALLQVAGILAEWS